MGPLFIDSREAQSEVIGYALLLGILITAVGLIIVLSAPIIQDSKDDAYLKNMEQGFTMLDSKISMVALGQSPSQVVQMYSQAGAVVIDDDNYSRISVVFYNRSSEIEVYDGPLGTIEYQLGQEKVAYEGGGVFRKYPGNGDPITITPPEFHYNGETLTLPIIRLTGNKSIGGSGVINLYFKTNSTTLLFPNSDTNTEFTNPLLIEKQVKVVIKSEYYKAWERYIEERTDASATSNDATKEVTVLLNSRSDDQDRELEYPIDVYGFHTENESALKNFSFTFNATGKGAAQFALDLETDTSPPFRIEMSKSGGLGTGGVTVYFKYGTSPTQEIWRGNVTLGHDPVNDTYSFDFVDTPVIAEYTGNTNSWTWNDETPPYNKTYTKSTSTDLPSVQKIVQHYMEEVGPTFSFRDVTTQGPEKGYWIDRSSFVLYYETAPPRITYLHIVEHSIQADVA